MNETQFFVTEVCHRLEDSLKQNNAMDIAKSLRSLLEDLSQGVKENPLRSIAASVALGFVLGNLVRFINRSNPKEIGKKIGSFAAVRFLEKYSPATFHAMKSNLPH